MPNTRKSLFELVERLFEVAGFDFEGIYTSVVPQQRIEYRMADGREVSVEFAAAQFGTRLVVVMGHSQCGAVTATLDVMRGTATNHSRYLRSIVDRVRPSIERLLAEHGGDDPEALLHAAVRANVSAAANQLRHGSELLEQLIREDGLLVVGAEYSLESGVVTFVEGVPATD